MNASRHVQLVRKLNESSSHVSHTGAPTGASVSPNNSDVQNTLLENMCRILYILK